MMTRRWEEAALVLLVAGWAAAAATAPTAPLGKRYVDPIHGFSLCPPRDTIRRRGFSTARLVTWQKRAAKSGAIVWTLSVRQVLTEEKDLSLKEYARKIEAGFGQTGKFRVESTRVQPVAGKGAIDIRGVTEAPIHLWERQVWVLVDPGRFLVFRINGPPDDRKHLNAICSDVLATLKLTDPKAALAERRESLLRGKKLLAALDNRKLRDAVHPQPQWFLMTHQDEDVGFMHVTESWTRVEGSEGLAVRTCVLLQMPKAARRVLRQRWFATAVGGFEKWREDLQQTPRPGRIEPSGEEGVRKNELILCSLIRQGRSHSRQTRLPKDLQDIYLPRALAWCVLRLVDLKQPAKYAFACYTSAENNFDMRTFAVAKAEKIRTVFGEVSAVCATDQAAADAEPATLWVSPEGRLLRMKNAQGMVISATTRAAVVRRFPQAETLVSARPQK